jgi:hypothetical protein
MASATWLHSWSARSTSCRPERDVDRQPAPAAAAIDDDPQLAVGHEHLVTVEVAQRGRAHGQVLDGRDPALELDQITDAELILDDDEHAGDHVAHQRLGAEAERDAEDPGARQQRLHVPAEIARIRITTPPTTSAVIRLRSIEPSVNARCFA